MFTDDEKVRIRAHLGYLNVQEASTFVLGIPAGVQTQFMIEGAFNRVLPAAENLAREYLCHLDNIEKAVIARIDEAGIQSVGGVSFTGNTFREQSRIYCHYRMALAQLFGVIPNPFDARPLVNSSKVGNVSVR